MEIKTHQINGKDLAEIASEEVLITQVEDALDLLGNVYYQGYDSIIVHQKNITPEFFDLKNKMAGEILQKFSNYRVRLAIVGDFSGFSSKSLNDFIFESNKGKQINFVISIDEAVKALAS